MAAPTRLVALLVALPFVLGACGQSAKDSATDFKGDQKDIAQTVEDLQSFARKGDSDKICNELLARPLIAKITTASKTTCDTAIKDTIRDADAFELQVQKVIVSGTTATAVVQSQAGDDDRTSTLTFVKDAAVWKIATLGVSAPA